MMETPTKPHFLTIRFFSWKCLAGDYFKAISREIILVNEGSAQLEVASLECTVNKGDLLILGADDVVRAKSERTVFLELIRVGWKHDHSFDQAEIECLEQAQSENIRHLAGANESMKAAAHLIRAMACESELPSRETQRSLPLLFPPLLTICSRQMGRRLRRSPCSHRPVVDARLQPILNSIQKRLGEKIDWDAEAKKAGFTPQYFRKYFQKTMGCTATQYLLETRIRQAEKRIITSNATVSEICYEVGFKTMSAFNAAFRKITNSYPRYLRACIQQGLTQEQVDKNLRDQARQDMRERWRAPYPRAKEMVASQWCPLELTASYNRPVRDSTGGNGWFGGTMSFDYLPTGRVSYHGIPFDLPAENKKQKNTCLILRSSVMRMSRKRLLPVKVALPLPPHVTALYVLHACAWGLDPLPFAYYGLRFQDGTEHRVPVQALGVISPEDQSGQQARYRQSLIQDWWPCYEQFENASARPIPIEKPDDPQSLRYLYTAEIINPSPHLDLDSFIIESDPQRETTLAVLAITVTSRAYQDKSVGWDSI